MTVEAIRSGIDLTYVDSACPPPRRSVRPCQRPLAGRVQDPGRPRHRRRVPVALRPRRGAGPRPDHRSRATSHGAAIRAPTSSASATCTRASWTSRPWPSAVCNRCSTSWRRSTPPQTPRGPGGGGRRAAAHRRRRRRGRLRRHRLQGLDALPAAPQPVRARTARRVLLPRRAARRDPRRLPAAHRRDVRPRVRRAITPRRPRAIVALETKLAAAHWDVVKRRDADLTYNLRTFADLPAEAPGLRLGRLGDRNGHDAGGGRGSRCAPARLPDRVRRAVVGRGPRGLEELGPLAADPRSRRPCSPTTLVAEDFAFYGRTAERHRGDPRPLEARRVGGGEPDGRCRRQALRRAALPAGCQGADGRTGRQSARGLPRQHQRPGVDDAADARARRWPSWTSSPRRSAIRRSGGTTRSWSSSATTSTATTAAATR